MHSLKTPQRAERLRGPGRETARQAGPPSSQRLLETAVQRAELDPGRLSPDQVLRLQRAVGNQAVRRLLEPSEPRGQPAVASPRIQRATATYRFAGGWDPEVYDEALKKFRQLSTWRIRGGVSKDARIEEARAYFREHTHGAAPDKLQGIVNSLVMAYREIFREDLDVEIEEPARPPAPQEPLAPESPESPVRTTERPVETAPLPDLKPEALVQIKNILLEAIPEATDQEVPPESTVRSVSTEGSETGRELQPVVQDNLPMAKFVQENAIQQVPSDVPPAPSSYARRIDQAQVGIWNKIKGRMAKAKPFMSQVGTVGGWIGHGAARVMSVIGVVLQGVAAFFDWHAFLSSTEAANDLKDVLEKSRAQLPKPLSTADLQILEAVEYAVKQKTRKAAMRYMQAMAGYASAGVSIAAFVAAKAVGFAALAALLASNPVGWGIAMAIAAIALAVTVGIFCYKIYRWFKKRKERGQQRQQMATRLVDGVLAGNAIAVQAVQSLHLDPLAISKECGSPPKGQSADAVKEGWIARVMRKLKVSG